MMTQTPTNDLSRRSCLVSLVMLSKGDVSHRDETHVQKKYIKQLVIVLYNQHPTLELTHCQVKGFGFGVSQTQRQSVQLACILMLVHIWEGQVG